MSKRLLLLLLAVGLVGAAGYGIGALGTGVAGAGQEAAKTEPSEEEKAIRLTLGEFVKAFNAGDAKGVAATFTAEAEFIDDDGNGIRGREQIEKLMAKFLEDNKGAKLQATLGGIRFVAPNVALEDGESVVTVPKKQEESARRYAMVFVKQEKKWLLGSIREFPEAEDTAVAPEETLKQLEWMIGEWIDEGNDSAVVTSCRWSEDRTCLLRDFTVKVLGKDAMKGTQRIGVDPLTGQIKGWVFDSTGGHGESCWFKNGEGWLVKATGVTAEGLTSSATYTLTPQGQDKVVMKTLHRVVGDQVEPDMEVALVRKPPQPK